jgi:tRNA-splicing ligase RtcB
MFTKPPSAWNRIPVPGLELVWMRISAALSAQYVGCQRDRARSGHPQTKENLYSTVHGAGRVMSRTAAAGKFKGWGANRKQVAPGLVDEDLMRANMKQHGIHLFGAGADEAPQCYKKLEEVLSFHQDSIAIETRLTPIVVCMAGSDIRDPYKD